MSSENNTGPDNIIINEVKLILAEKRTSLAALRTGIAVFILPLSVLSFLVATSKFYHIVQVIHFIIPIFIICGALIILGFYLIIRSLIRLHRYDHMILNIKRKNTKICEFLD